MLNINTSYLIDTLQTLLRVPSPVGYYVQMKPVLEQFAASFGYTVTYDNRNTAYISVTGEDTSKTVCVGTHADTLGFMVRGINNDGTLRLRPVGGINFCNVEGENVTIHTRKGQTFTGLLLCRSHSSHAFEDARSLLRDENTVYVLLDEPVKTKAATEALGIRHGDYVSIDTRFTMTPNGYIKSRFIDNRAAMSCAFTVLKYLSDNRCKPKFNTVFAFPFYEEVGLGGAYVPAEISEYVAVDIGILDPDADGDERGVTICAKDASMPYDYDLTNRLIAYAEKAGCKYAVDLFFRYGSDAGQAIKGGNNVRHAAFGMPVYCSHGVERAHIDGIENTAKLLLAYVLDI